MKILDKYILKKFLSAYFFVVLLLSAVLIVVDFTEKNEDFIKTKPGLYRIVFDYYINFVPYMANLLSPITIFIATVFVTAQLAGRTEIIAILSSGVSFRRFLVPYIIGATLIGIGIFYLNGYVIPNSNKTRVAFEVKYLKDPFYYDKRNVHFKSPPDTNKFVYFESYNNSIHTGYQFTIETIQGTKLIKKLKAETVTWLPDKQKWQIKNYSQRTFDGDKETLTFGKEIDTTLNIKPKDFESNYMFYETLTNPELEAVIEEKRNRLSDDQLIYIIEKNLRITYPFAILILTVIGVILSARKTRGGTGFQIALGFGLAFIYILSFIMSRSIANAGSMDPLLAVWLPNIIFTGIGVFLYNTVPR